MQPKIEALEDHINGLNRERESIIGKISKEKAELNKTDIGSNATQKQIESRSSLENSCS